MVTLVGYYLILLKSLEMADKNADQSIMDKSMRSVFGKINENNRNHIVLILSFGSWKHSLRSYRRKVKRDF